jgi:hypothetical protein
VSKQIDGFESSSISTMSLLPIEGVVDRGIITFLGELRKRA